MSPCSSANLEKTPTVKSTDAKSLSGGSWLKVLKNDKRAIFTAAAKAQEAFDWLTRSTSTPELEEAA